jgi:hypothetical protein
MQTYIFLYTLSYIVQWQRHGAYPCKYGWDTSRSRVFLDLRVSYSRHIRHYLVFGDVYVVHHNGQCYHLSPLSNSPA